MSYVLSVLISTVVSVGEPPVIKQVDVTPINNKIECVGIIGQMKALYERERWMITDEGVNGSRPYLHLTSSKNDVKIMFMCKDKK